MNTTQPELQAVYCCDNVSARFSIVIPAYNEEDNVAGILGTFRSLYPDAEVILVDNNSRDATRQQAQRIPGVVLGSEQVAGKGAAMRRGLQMASREFVLFHDSDLEYDPRDVLALMQRQVLEPAAMVCGNRQISIGQLPWKSIAAMSLVRWLLRQRFGPLPGLDILTGTRCASRQTWQRLRLQSDDFAIETESVRNACELSIPIVSLPVSYVPRSIVAGKKIRALDLFKLLQVALN